MLTKSSDLYGCKKWMPPKQQDIEMKETASMSGYQKKKKKQTASVSGYQICGIDHYKVLMDEFFLKTAGKNSFEKEPTDVTNK